MERDASSSRVIAPYDDGLELPEVGRWCDVKYHCLRPYLEAFTTSMRGKWRGLCYLDLFAGAGYAKIRDSEKIVLGSPLIAGSLRFPFSKIVVAEANSQKLSALRVRLQRHLPPDQYVTFLGDANEIIRTMIKEIQPGWLSVAFVDPYGIHVEFNTIKAVAERRCDLLVLLADNVDAMRNWRGVYVNEDSQLDRFLGTDSWRHALQWADGTQFVREFRKIYQEQLKAIGYEYFRIIPVKNNSNRDIYSLLFASRHKVAVDLWDKTHAIGHDGQRELFGG